MSTSTAATTSQTAAEPSTMPAARTFPPTIRLIGAWMGVIIHPRREGAAAMPKIRALVRQPVAVVVLLVLLAVTAHAATLTMFTSRDTFQSQFNTTIHSYNFTGVPDTGGQVTLESLTVLGDFRLSGGLINFTSTSNSPLAFAINFNGNDVSYFGADVIALSRPGIYNFSAGGTSALINFTSSIGFIGFSSDIPFPLINVTFTPL